LVEKAGKKGKDPSLEKREGGREVSITDQGFGKKPFHCMIGFKKALFNQSKEQVGLWTDEFLDIFLRKTISTHKKEEEKTPISRQH